MAESRTALPIKPTAHAALTRFSGGHAQAYELVAELAGYIARLEQADFMTAAHVEAAARIAAGNDLGDLVDADDELAGIFAASSIPGSASLATKAPPVSDTRSMELFEPERSATSPAPAAVFPSAAATSADAAAMSQAARVPMALRSHTLAAPRVADTRRTLMAGVGLLVLGLGGVGTWLVDHTTGPAPLAEAAAPKLVAAPIASAATAAPLAGPATASLAPSEATDILPLPPLSSGVSTAPPQLAPAPPPPARKIPAETLPPLRHPVQPPAAATVDTPRRRLASHSLSRPAREPTHDDTNEMAREGDRDASTARDGEHFQPGPREPQIRRYVPATEWQVWPEIKAAAPRAPASPPVQRRYAPSPNEMPDQRAFIGSFVMGPDGVRMFVPSP